MKIRQNPILPHAIPELVREFSVLWRELATAFNATIADTTSTDGAARNRLGTDTTDDIIIDNSDAGLVLKSPDGRYWRVRVTNFGSLTITNLGTTKP